MSWPISHLHLSLYFVARICLDVVDFGDEEWSDAGGNDKNGGFELAGFPRQEAAQTVDLES